MLKVDEDSRPTVVHDYIKLRSLTTVNIYDFDDDGDSVGSGYSLATNMTTPEAMD